MEKNSSIRALIMTLSQTFVCFSSPVRLSMQISLSPRPRVVPSGDVLLLEKDDREFTELPMYLHIDPVRRYMLAYLSPIPAPLVIYGPEDFGPASSDTMEEHAERVIAICGEGDQEVIDLADDIIAVPDVAEYLQPILVSIPLQLLAYEIALLRGCDVDKPRNLAKSVTVE